MLEIHLEDLSRSFGERQVLRGISTVIRGGERLLVRGPNGSGKTTLLKVLAGLLGPTGGGFRVLDGGDARDDAWRRRWTGYVSPDLVLYDEFSPLENLAFFSRVRALDPEPTRDRALLERVGLGDRFHQPVGTLSTGLRQRAKLAFALQGSPRVLLLDEPGANLDQPGRTFVADTVTSFSGPETIVIVATNDPAEFGLGTRTLELA